MGRKLGAVPIWGGGAGSPYHNVPRAEVYVHAKFHLDPSNRLATVQQRYIQTDRSGHTGQTDRQTERQRYDGIERTVLQTVDQKCVWRVSRVRVTWQGKDCLVIMVRDMGVLIITTPAFPHFMILLGNWKLWIPLFMRIKY